MNRVQPYVPIIIILILVICSAYLLITASDSPTRATYFSTIVVLTIYLIDQYKKLRAQDGKDERVREQLRAYAELDQILSDLLNIPVRYHGIEVGMRIADLPSAVANKIDDVLQRDASLLDPCTKDSWRMVKVNPFKIGLGPQGIQMIDIELADKLQTHIRGQIQTLKKTLNLE